MEIIVLQPGQIAPEGAEWIGVGPVIGGRWNLEGTIPTPPGSMSIYGDYGGISEAVDAGIAFALRQGVAVLYVETDARRCD